MGLQRSLGVITRRETADSVRDSLGCRSGSNGSTTVGRDDPSGQIMSTRFAITSCNVPRISRVSDP